MGTGTVLVAVNGKTDDLKSALSVRVPFCAFVGVALLHVGPPILQFGHPFLKGFDRIYSPVRAGDAVPLRRELDDLKLFAVDDSSHNQRKTAPPKPRQRDRWFT